MNKNFLSIIIPTYNRLKLLEKCLDSLCQQLYPKDKYEVIIVDDGSDEEMQNFVSSYKKQDCNFSFYKQTSNGPAAARNLGAKHAKGNFLVFIDDDCFAPDNFLNQINKCLNEYPGMAAYVGAVIPIFNHRVLRHLKGFYEKKFSKANAFIANHITPKTELRTDCSVVNKDNFNAIGGFDIEFKRASGEDVDLGFRLLENHYKILFTNQILIYHCQRSTLNSTIRRFTIFGITDTRNFSKYFKNKLIFSGLFNKVTEFSPPGLSFYFHVNLFKQLLFILCLMLFNMELALIFLLLIFLYHLIKNMKFGVSFIELLVYLYYCLLIESIFFISHIVGSIKYKVFYL
jgi:GT2 family glycosyltransferase